MRIVVGLGNPGRRYAATRHNVGFRVLEALCGRWGVLSGKGAFSGVVYEARPRRSGQPAARVLMLEPHTYMNCSGQAVKGLASFYRVEAPDVLVVLDDMALPTGQLRMRDSGSAGGHNGLADVLAEMGSSDVPRLRIGIGSPPLQMDARDYVLSRFGKEDAPVIDRAVSQAADAVEDWVFLGSRYVMDQYNRKTT